MVNRNAVQAIIILNAVTPIVGAMLLIAIVDCIDAREFTPDNTTTK